MNGHILTGTSIAVDYFKGRQLSSVKFFFLTHAHADHMVGLISTWRSGVIYMSEITSRIVQHDRKINRKWIHVLAAGESNMIQGELNKESFVVTTIDANHCPGAVMFLFQGSFGNFLYTGDFRYCESICSVESLRQCSKLNRLYLDNTYCMKEVNFPSREVATREVIRIIAENDEKDIYVAVNRLGKEKLLIAIAEHFHLPIVVSQDRYNRLKITSTFPMKHFTTNFYASRIKTANFNSVFGSIHINVKNDVRLFILPTALYAAKVHDVPINKRFVVVPYSDHSCYSELEAFVKQLKPMEIIPIVNDRKEEMHRGISRAKMSVFNQYLSTPEVTKSSPRNDVTPFTAPTLLDVELSVCNSVQSRKRKRLVSRRLDSSKGVQFESSSEDECVENNGNQQSLWPSTHFQRFCARRDKHTLDPVATHCDDNSDLDVDQTDVQNTADFATSEDLELHTSDVMVVVPSKTVWPVSSKQPKEDATGRLQNNDTNFTDDDEEEIQQRTAWDELADHFFNNYLFKKST